MNEDSLSKSTAQFIYTEQNMIISETGILPIDATKFFMCLQKALRTISKQSS